MTAETAVALPALAVLLGAALWAVTVTALQLQCADAARLGARAAARGEPLPAVSAAVTRAAPPGATVAVNRDRELTRVTVTARPRPPLLVPLPRVPVVGRASVATEPEVPWPGGDG